MGPGSALQADSLIGSSPISSTKFYGYKNALTLGMVDAQPVSNYVFLTISTNLLR